MSDTSQQVHDESSLSWARHDVEQRLGFKGGKYTCVNNLLTFGIAIYLTVLSYFGLSFLPMTSSFRAMLLDRGPTPYAIVFLFFWSASILAIKWSKLRLQMKVLNLHVIPIDSEFVLSPTSAQQVLDATYLATDNPSHFLLFNRIHVALSNLKNIGRVADVDDILRSQPAHEASIVESSYALIRGFIWGIPILGFIGTVMGLSEAIGEFGAVLSETTDTSQITTALQGVTSGLATAFETTLVALVAAFFLQMVVTFLRKGEDDFLDDCDEYCLRNVVSRLRITPFEQGD